MTKTMKRVIGIAAVAATVGFAPMAAAAPQDDAEIHRVNVERHFYRQADALPEPAGSAAKNTYNRLIYGEGDNPRG